MTQIEIFTDIDLRQVGNKINKFLVQPEVLEYRDTKITKEQDLYIAVVVYKRRAGYGN